MSRALTILALTLASGVPFLSNPQTVQAQHGRAYRTHPLGPSAPATGASQQERETIFDRVVHLVDGIITEIPATPRLEETLGIEGRRISVGDAELWVEEEGSGTPIVLINGGPGGTHHGFHPWFGRASEFARVIYYDQRGCGLSDYEPGPDGYSVEQAVADLDALRTSLGIDKMVLVGTSYGGFLAQFYTTQYPENVAGLVLVGASPNISASTGRSRQQEFISQQEQEKMQEIRARLREMAPERGWTDAEFLALLVYNNHLNGDWKRQNYYRPTPAELAHVALYEWVQDGNFNSIMGQSAGRVDLTGAFNSNPIPTLIMEGEWDLTWGPEKKHALAANHPHGHMVTFEEAGHSIFNEDPDGFFTTLQEFVEELDPVNPGALATFQSDLRQWQTEWMASPAYRLKAVDWGMGASETIAAQFSPEWMNQLTSAREFLRLGFALYDVKRYDDALSIFVHYYEEGRASGDDSVMSMAGIWAGHMLDLLERRDEAVARYREVKELGRTDSWSHGQYGMRYSFSAYATARMETPFKRLENRER